MTNMLTIHTRWHDTKTALISLDHALAAVPGAADQSHRVCDLVRAFRADVEEQLRLAGQAVERLQEPA